MRPKRTSWQNLPKGDGFALKSAMNISLPDSLKDYLDEQIGEGGYGPSSE